MQQAQMVPPLVAKKAFTRLKRACEPRSSRRLYAWLQPVTRGSVEGHRNPHLTADGMIIGASQAVVIDASARREPVFGP